MKQLHIIFLLTILMSTVGAKTFAYDIAVPNSDGKTIYYSYANNNTELTVTYCSEYYDSYSYDYTGNIVIPEIVTYNGTNYTVTSIGSSAFYNCSDLISITIPSSVTSISSLAFSGCSGLTSISIESGNTVYDSRNNCNAIIETSSNTLIQGCMNTVIPNSVTLIGSSAFAWCSGLTSIIIPNSVTSIGSNAFRGCSGLTSIIIPNSVTSIGSSAFASCSGLTSISVESGNTAYDSRSNCKAIIETSANTLIQGCMNTIIPNNITSIGSSAFFGCSSLTSITIPNSVTYIGREAFRSCSNLISITIPNSVTSIGSSAFSGCSGLTSITIPNSVTSIGAYAFSGCSGLTSITIPNSVTSIGSDAFRACSGLTSIIIPNSVTSIGSYAFLGCSGLTSITIGNGTKIIYSHAFANCSKLSDVYCHVEDIPSTNSSAFDGSYIENATLYVLSGSLQAYRNAEPWSKFGTIRVLTPETPKCATPIISFGGKKLTFDCETEGVEYVTEIKDADIGMFYDKKITLSATYEISVYATKAGYNNSDKATATLVWANATFTDTTPSTDINNAPEIATMPILIQSNGGTLSVQGADDGTQVSIYNTAGQMTGSAVSNNGRAIVSTNMETGTIAIVKIGNRAIKVAIK